MPDQNEREIMDSTTQTPPQNEPLDDVKANCQARNDENAPASVESQVYEELRIDYDILSNMYIELEAEQERLRVDYDHLFENYTQLNTDWDGLSDRVLKQSRTNLSRLRNK
ncbi:hypothetical protein O1611_g5118 [Lasiodiplodia mahajangana]|uniref:Uncharacterized protein n=1 Tax=Lasiodiplodia mahajangana TaxID=1108764 RepID=A0ACC2JM90_9PEZI|nr:hypothetical protein O1611_g5118 [Lasiodiplodia mahajangana]